MKSWRKVPWLSVGDAKAEIVALTEKIKHESDPRSRIKLARRLAFAGVSMAFCQEELSLPELEKGIAALGLARKTGAEIADLNRSQAWLAKLRLEAMGCADAKILAEKKKTVWVDSACLAAAPDTAKGGEFLTWPNDDIVASMNEGRFFVASFQADGRYSVTLRWVDASEPVLQPDEYNILEASSEVGFLRVDSEELRFGAAEHLDEGAVLKVPNGLMKVQIFCLLKHRRGRIILVACPTKKIPPPLIQLIDIPF